MTIPFLPSVMYDFAYYLWSSFIFEFNDVTIIHIVDNIHYKEK
jgi:hypothetical protein